MKNRKRIITTLVGLSLTSQILPSAYTIVANAQTTNVVKEQAQGATNNSQQQQNELANNVIKLYGIGCEETSKDGKHGYHEVQISFEANKLKTTVISGYPDDENHPFHPYFKGEYITITLLNSAGEIKESFTLAGTDNIGKLKAELDKWEFTYGDYLRISHDEADWRAQIEGSVTYEKDISKTDLTKISKDYLNKHDFEITQHGLNVVERKIKEVETASDLVSSLKESLESGAAKTIKLKNNIEFDQNAINMLPKSPYDSTKRELVIPKNVTIDGGGFEINFNDKASLTLKGNYTRLQFVTIKGCDNNGIHIYNSCNSYLREVTVDGCKGYGLFINGSNVNLQNCTTKNNTKGGVLISTSISLNRKNNCNSKVKVMDGLNNQEKTKILVKDLQLLDKVTQKNTFIKDVNQNYTEVEYEESSYLNPIFYPIFNLDPSTKVKVIEKYKEFK